MTALAVERTRVCTQCPENGPQPWSAFYAGKKWPDGTMRYPMSWCKACLARVNAERCRRYHHTIMADPERHAVRQAQWRDYARRVKGIAPERYRTGASLEGPLVPVAALLPAVEASGLPEATISLAAGYADSTVTKALKRETVSLEMAVRVLRVLDVAPAEVGL